MEMALHHHPSHGIELMTVVPLVAGLEELVLQWWLDKVGWSSTWWLWGGGGGLVLQQVLPLLVSVQPEGLTCDSGHIWQHVVLKYTGKALHTGFCNYSTLQFS